MQIPQAALNGVLEGIRALTALNASQQQQQQQLQQQHEQGPSWPVSYPDYSSGLARLPTAEGHSHASGHLVAERALVTQQWQQPPPAVKQHWRAQQQQVARQAPPVISVD